MGLTVDRSRGRACRGDIKVDYRHCGRLLSEQLMFDEKSVWSDYTALPFLAYVYKSESSGTFAIPG